MKYSETCSCGSQFALECLDQQTFFDARDNWRTNHTHDRELTARFVVVNLERLPYDMPTLQQADKS
jgi:hypothetical protein